MNEIRNLDEYRLLKFFRCLSPEAKFDAMEKVASMAVLECIPDTSIYEIMPDDAGIEPEGIDFIDGNIFSMSCHLLRNGRNWRPGALFIRHFLL